MSDLKYSAQQRPYQTDINDLIEANDFIFKGRALPVGTVRNWSGTEYIKTAQGWIPHTNGSKEPKASESDQSKPQKPAPTTKTTSPNEITSEEIEALKEYQSGSYGSALGGYGYIQQYLRVGTVPGDSWNAKDEAAAKEVIKNVSSAINKHPVEKPMSVYRGLRIRSHDEGSKVYENVKVGDIIQDKGFTSTSTNKNIGKKFSEKLSRSDIPVQIEIQLNPGDHALPMDKYHKHDTEKEVLLDRNVKFKVVSVRNSAAGKHVVLTMDQEAGEIMNPKHSAEYLSTGKKPD